MHLPPPSFSSLSHSPLPPSSPSRLTRFSSLPPLPILWLDRPDLLVTLLLPTPRFVVVSGLLFGKIDIQMTTHSLELGPCRGFNTACEHTVSWVLFLPLLLPTLNLLSFPVTLFTCRRNESGRSKTLIFDDVLISVYWLPLGSYSYKFFPFPFPVPLFSNLETIWKYLNGCQVKSIWCWLTFCQKYGCFFPDALLAYVDPLDQCHIWLFSLTPLPCYLCQFSQVLFT